MNFSELKLSSWLLASINKCGYAKPTPIQLKSIPIILEGKDVLGCAQTGTGKTAAFALPIIQKLNMKKSNRRRTIRSLILAPTRELAVQIADSFKLYGQKSTVKHTAIYGGVKQFHQVRDLNRGIDVAVATPGRLLDLIDQGYVDLSNVEILVLDEADRMLDMGFIHDIRKIVATIPHKRQTLLFSATLSNTISKFSKEVLSEPVKIFSNKNNSTVDKIKQSLCYVKSEDKLNLLNHIISEAPIYKGLVFTRTKYGADKLSKKLSKSGIKSVSIHGDKSQRQRQKALDDFKRGNSHFLVATDVAARGLDIDNVSHVINFDIPNEAEAYIHRIGRTGRAGADGVAISFCSSSEKSDLLAIQRLLKTELAVDTKHPFHIEIGNIKQKSSRNRRFGGRKFSDNKRKPQVQYRKK